ncbi:hypothetical protein [Nocardioides sp. GY 10127]|uniref:hypothetical protein n=1 Tax=Nocardioides sp. GY 10127 TaxID=2569762 RepID=UPI0010A94CBE|nr:hypothetical protein [Nocardioides sp. GY 10127]TIC84391.1 hypothetical protein E8D37_06385 [Nocardioides sp. GY 10127]
MSSPQSPRPHHRPTQKTAAFFETVEGGPDPMVVGEAADRAASLLVRGAREVGDDEVADRVLHLADAEGLETLADLWAGAPADTLAGCLWRLYLLRSWVHADPIGAARDFEAGRASAQVARVVAGVADPPGPEALKAMVDEVLRGIATGDFADVLFRAAAFARVVAAGRATREQAEDGSGSATSAGADVRRVLALSEQLESAGHHELREPLA